MNEQWYPRLAQARREQLLQEARQDQLAREAGIRDRVPPALKAAGLLLAGVPLVLLLLRGWLKV